MKTKLKSKMTRASDRSENNIINNDHAKGERQRKERKEEERAISGRGTRD